ncbi:hypothetical protein YB2330_005112 [Saitoella coloradoensis]
MSDLPKISLPEFESTSLDLIPALVEELRASFNANRTKSVEFRKTQLKQLFYLVHDHADRFREALAEDLHKPAVEAWAFEISPAKDEIQRAIDSLDEWVKPEKPAGIPFFPFSVANKPVIRKEPKGVACVIGTWNYPLILCLKPLVGAIAAGCTAIIKPSEQAPKVGALLHELFPQYMDPMCYRVVLGHKEEAERLLQCEFDHIFYTGSAGVGKLIMKAAAEHLTPVTLELGGKSPAIVTRHADVALAAKRIAWAKFANAGQTCVAPDYVLVAKSIQNEFVAALEKVINEFYEGKPQESKEYGRIVNEAQWTRVAEILEKTEGHVVIGGNKDVSDLYIEPTVVTDVAATDSLMESEIFGPILPIITVEDSAEAVKFVRENANHPLALYAFTGENKTEADYILDNTLSGTAAINECMWQLAVPQLPFGGVRTSGHGTYVGKASFDTFSHHRSVVEQPKWMEYLVGLRYPGLPGGGYDHVTKLEKYLKSGQDPQPKFQRPGEESVLVSLMAFLGASVVPAIAAGTVWLAHRRGLTNVILGQVRAINDNFNA